MALQCQLNISVWYKMRLHRKISRLSSTELPKHVIRQMQAIKAYKLKRNRKLKIVIIQPHYRVKQ